MCKNKITCLKKQSSRKKNWAKMPKLKNKSAQGIDDAQIVNYF